MWVECTFTRGTNDSGIWIASDARFSTPNDSRPHVPSRDFGCRTPATRTVTDVAADIVAQVHAARVARSTLAIRGNGSKTTVLGSPGGASILDLSPHTGIVSYRPEEQVITVRGGTPLTEVIAELAAHRQCLGAEPPVFRGMGTIGGAVASGLSGPARPFRGSLRDSVLGVDMINGLGERLHFGGEVFKNVAGFDVSRLMAGSEGAFGVLLSTTLRVVPQPERIMTRCQTMEAAAAVSVMRRWAALPLPLSGLAWSTGQLHWRLSGAAAAVGEADDQLGGVEDDPDFWQQLRDGEHAWMTANDAQRGRLWRHAVAPASAVHVDDVCIDWAGSLRWRWHAAVPEPALQLASEFACPLGASSLTCGREGLLLRRIKDAFDPDHIFNPGLIYADAPA